jgi:hypothetical protein
LQFDYLFIQPIQLVLVRRSPSRQLLSRIQVVAPQSRTGGLPGVVELGKAIHPFFDLTHEGRRDRSNECILMIWASKHAQ